VIRERVQQQLAALPGALRVNRNEPPYPVEIARELCEMAAQLDRETH
jgi:hypothetical protein